MLTSFADFERRFGGLDVASPMSYAVRDFYLNGGSLALIVRVLHDDAASRDDHARLAAAARPTTWCSKHRVAASWGNRLSAPRSTMTPTARCRAASPPATNEQRFNLTVRYRTRPGRDKFVVETFGSVSTVEGDRALPAAGARARVRVRARAGRVMPATRPPSNVTQAGSQRVVTWVDADTGSGSDGSRHRRRRRDRRTRTRRPASTR